MEEEGSVLHDAAGIITRAGESHTGNVYLRVLVVNQGEDGVVFGSGGERGGC